MARKVLITAGAAGIGLELVRAFAALGDCVFTCDIDDAALGKLRSELPGVHAVRCDIGSRGEVERFVPEAIAALGGLDILVNNAGMSGPTAPMDAMPPQDWDRTLAVNVTGMFDVTRLAIPALKQSAAGVIVNMSSAAGRFGFPNRTPYAASKWAVIGLTKTLSIELGAFNVRVNAIAPGAVAGERIERVFAGRAQVSGKSVEEARAIAMGNQSIKAMIDPKDIAQLAVFLASDAAKTISGQVIPIDADRQKG